MSRRRTASVEPVPRGDRLRPVWVGSLVAILVAFPLVPTETVQFGGAVFVLLLLVWLLAVGWSLASLLRPASAVLAGPATWLWAAFLAWHSWSALRMAWEGNPRASLNMMWLWLSFGVVFFLARQLLTHPAERRAIVAVALGLAVSLAVLGFYQYAYELPMTRAAFRADPERVLREAGISAPEGTPQRKLFADRLDSSEPLATFALTNSFAGLLTPWFLVLVGVVAAGWSQLGTKWRVAVPLVTLLLLAACLVLTKSRTAWLATLFGLGLLAVYGRREGWRPDGRWVVGLGAAGALLPFIATVVGGLDWLVLLETSKSFLVRVQYWRATAALIGDFPWWGCGPGNFQQYYTAYKLPEASETIAEPHNFLLEIWATAGTPAAVLFVGIFAAAGWMFRGRPLPDTTSEGPLDAETMESTEPEAVRAIYWGGICGGLLGYSLCGFMEGYFPSVGLVIFGFPFGILLVSALHQIGRAHV